MNLSSLSENEIFSLLKNDGLQLGVGPFQIRLESNLKAIACHLHLHYGHYPVLDNSGFIDIFYNVSPTTIVRRYVRPQANFSLDGFFPFNPVPLTQASALFEWGLNWCIGQNSSQYLMVHAAVVERNGQALVFPGTPGSGKSTLCAALVGRGWRLLTDEMALFSTEDCRVYPIPRPISLKNQSIDLIAEFCPDQVIGSIVQDTVKGTIGHMRPSDASVECANKPGIIRQIIFPKYIFESATVLSPLSKGRAFLKLAENSFNYHVLGKTAFSCIGQICDQSECFEFRYSRLDEAVDLFTGRVN